MKDFTRSGEWWLPENPEKKLAGNLVFDNNDGGKLITVGAFIDHIENYINQTTSNPRIILGITTEGEQVTLVECQSIATTVVISAISPPQSTSFYVKIVLIGEHFHSLETINFNSISARLRHVDQWLGISGFTEKLDFRSRNIHIDYAHPETMRYTLSDDLFLSFFFSATRHAHDTPQTESRISQKSYIRLESNILKHINSFTDDLICIKGFLSLGVRHAVILLELTGRIEGEIGKEVEIYYVLPYADQFNDISISEDRMLFPFSFVKENFQKFIHNWYSNRDEFKPILESFFSIRDNPSSYPRHKFLSYMQAIESYHRKKFEGKLISDDRFNSILKPALTKTIQDAVVEYQRVNFISKLDYFNEFSLRNRLKELFASDMFKPLIKNQPIVPFITQLVDWRNYLTHFDESLKGRCSNFEVLRGIVPKLEPILETLILDLLGMTHEQIEVLLLKKWIKIPTMEITRA